MRQFSARFFCLAAFFIPVAAVAADSDLTGRWEIKTTYPGGSLVAGLDLESDASGHFTGRSGYLVPDGFFYFYSGSVEKGVLKLQILAPDRRTAFGSLELTAKGHELTGNGTIREVPVTVSAHRPVPRPAGGPRVIDFVPKAFYHTLSGANPPALRIFPGDTVRTSTVDAGGGGKDASQRSLPGNRQTGPFYIEGAMLGDTIAVHFNRIRPNRDTAFQYRGALAPIALPPGYPRQPSENWSQLWKIDRARNTATPMDPSEKLKGLELKIVPMLGVVGVAPYWDQAIAAADLGPYGGNLDYKEIREGITLYLPVYQAGALLSMGDGHALQGDGEITGQGLETSMDVEFTVDLVKKKNIGWPRLENQTHVMVLGSARPLLEAFQIATAELQRWLTADYGMTERGAQTFMGQATEYEVANVVDPSFTVVAKIRKDLLPRR